MSSISAWRGLADEGFWQKGESFSQAGNDVKLGSEMRRLRQKKSPLAR
jgi:hypothetical protein